MLPNRIQSLRIKSCWAQSLRLSPQQFPTGTCFKYRCWCLNSMPNKNFKEHQTGGTDDRTSPASSSLKASHRPSLATIKACPSSARWKKNVEKSLKCEKGTTKILGGGFNSLTHLKHIHQIGSFPQVLVRVKNEQCLKSPARNPGNPEVHNKESWSDCQILWPR